MSISQLSVFVENKAGHLADALLTLAEGKVNVMSFTIADTTDYGILRLVVDQVERARDLLTAGQYVVVEHPVVCAVIPDEPGALAAVARLVADSGLDIEYLYLGARDSLLLKTEHMDRLEALLRDAGFRVLDPGDLM